MAGTVIGGKRAAATNKARYGEDFYRIQGAKGGRLGTTGGFAANPELARIAGAKGGKKSKRRKANETDSDYAKRLEKLKARRVIRSR